MNAAFFLMGMFAALLSGTPQAATKAGSAQDAKLAAGTFAVDAVHSTVIFRIKHLGLSFVYGRFNEIEGTFQFGDDDKSRVDITVKAASVDTNSEERDKHLRNEDFFDVEKYPDIKFKSDSIKKTAADKYEAVGKLTLHGVTKPLTVTITRVGSGPDPWGNFRSGFETTFTIKRSDFGMGKMLGAVGDEVRLTVSVEGIRE